eukprot:scaffold3356_cov112-Isochrysis_galbana.AAC.19
MAGAEPPLTRVGPLMHKALCCLRCGGFAGFRPAHTKGPIGYGRAVSRLVNWEHDDILGYFSRTLEEFGSSKLTRYLLRDSLACTIAQKHKLRSRAAAYRTQAPTLNSFPSPSSSRPRRFLTERAAPTWPCSSSSGCPIGHGTGTPTVPLFDSLNAAAAHDRREWQGAEARLAMRRVARQGEEASALVECAAGLTTSELRAILRRRAEARAALDFDAADAARLELAARGVHINDKLNRWEAADGRSGLVTPFALHSRGWGAARAQEGARPAPMCSDGIARRMG